MASEYLKKKYRDVKPEEKRELTPEEKRKNWWHYHKWHVGIAAALLGIVGSIAWNALTQVEPDYQIAYIGSSYLPDDAAGALEEAFARLGADWNGDGKVTVSLRQYVSGGADAGIAVASQVQLMADITVGESYFFLLEDPEDFQKKYEVLREDWFPAGDGLYLARRAFAEDRPAAHMDACGQMWDQLLEEAST